IEAATAARLPSSIWVILHPIIAIVSKTANEIASMSMVSQYGYLIFKIYRDAINDMPVYPANTTIDVGCIQKLCKEIAAKDCWVTTHCVANEDTQPVTSAIATRLNSFSTPKYCRWARVQAV